MQYETSPRTQTPVGALGTEARAAFISRTYGHLAGAVIAFTLLELVLFRTGVAESIATTMMGGPWLLFLGGFMIVGMLATKTAHTALSQPAQYAALFGYVAAEALLFVPLLYIADRFAPGVIASAALVTVVAFSGLTAVVFVTRKDFSFLRGVVMFGGIMALVAILAAAIFGANLGTWFSVAMVGLAGASVLYDTSKVLHHYPEDRHVAASLQLFAAIALMFWYVLRIMIALSARD
jgi:FtsH-binding integral membrane protein